MLSYLELGLRRSEALALKGEDLNLQGTEPTLTVRRRPDDREDTRRDKPEVKTHGRILPIGPELQGALRDWMIRHRRDAKRYPGAKRCPYVFVSRRGTALAKRTVNAMFDLLRLRIPDLPDDLTTHPLRHRWNDRFSELADQERVGEDEEIRQRNYLMGWGKTSRMAVTYTQRSTRARASKRMLDLQRRSTGKA